MNSFCFYYNPAEGQSQGSGGCFFAEKEAAFLSTESVCLERSLEKIRFYVKKLWKTA